MTKMGPTSNKLQQKLFMLNWTPKGVFFNISKVLRNPRGGRLSFLAIQIGVHIDLKVKVALSRSDRFWAGLSSDLVVIEQTLICSVKTTGGPTRGRGRTEIQRLLWLLSMPFTAEVNSSVQCLTEVIYVTSDQHKKSSKSRLERDLKDTKTVLELLEERNRSAEIPPYVTLGLVSLQQNL